MIATSTTVPDGTGNSLFGGSSIDGFVIDQNSINTTGNFSQNSATEETYQSGVGYTPTSCYGFNQPVTATTLPSGVGVTRSALNETGYFGGMMQCCSVNTTTNAIVNYGLAGTVSLQTDPASSRLAATFTSGGPYISTSLNSLSPLTNSALNALTLQFGSPPASGQNYGSSTFIDNNTFAAEESPNTPSVVNRLISGVPTVLTLPTLTNETSANSQYVPQLALVTSSVTANNARWCRAAPCASANSRNGASGPARSNRRTPPPPPATPTISRASIPGSPGRRPGPRRPPGSAAIAATRSALVYNNGAQYLAAGGVAANYNFATGLGTLTISNFDGNTFSGILNGTSGTPSYTASLSGANLIGFAAGTFYGPTASETGGNFGVYAQSGYSITAPRRLRRRERGEHEPAVCQLFFRACQEY